MLGIPWYVQNVVAFGINTFISLGFGASNRLAKFFKVGLKSNVEVSDKYPTLVTPAKYAFSIWSLIFALETASVLWQCTVDYPWLADASKPLSLGFLAQALWTFAFGMEEIVLSTVILCCLTGSFAYGYMLTRTNFPIRSPEYVLGNLPFGIHTAWVICASLLNANAILAKERAPYPSQVTAAWVTLLFASGIGGALTWYFKDPVFAFVFAWALRGISNNEASSTLTLRTSSESRGALKGFAKLSSAGLLLIGLLYLRTK